MEQEPHTYQPGPPSSGLAVASLISSILGLTLLPTIGSIIGVALGYIAKKQIEDSMGAVGGEGLAKGGIIVGWVGIGLSVLGLCLVLAIFLASGGITACALMQNGY